MQYFEYFVGDKSAGAGAAKGWAGAGD